MKSTTYLGIDKVRNAAKMLSQKSLSVRARSDASQLSKAIDADRPEIDWKMIDILDRATKSDAIRALTSQLLAKNDVDEEKIVTQGANYREDPNPENVSETMQEDPEIAPEDLANLRRQLEVESRGVAARKSQLKETASDFLGVIENAEPRESFSLTLHDKNGNHVKRWCILPEQLGLSLMKEIEDSLLKVSQASGDEVSS